MSDTQWLAIPGYEGSYEVSNDGQVRSLDRTNARGVSLRGQVISTPLNDEGYPKVNLNRDGHRVHRSVHTLVMLAFVGPRPADLEVLHKDGNPAHNQLANLSYGTRSENVQDSIAHGTNVNASKTHCNSGHAFTDDNTYRLGSRRNCRRCTDIRRQRYNERKAAA